MINTFMLARDRALVEFVKRVSRDQPRQGVLHEHDDAGPVHPDGLPAEEDEEGLVAAAKGHKPQRRRDAETAPSLRHCAFSAASVVDLCPSAMHTGTHCDLSEVVREVTNPDLYRLPNTSTTRAPPHIRARARPDNRSEFLPLCPRPTSPSRASRRLFRSRGAVPGNATPSPSFADAGPADNALCCWCWPLWAPSR